MSKYIFMILLLAPAPFLGSSGGRCRSSTGLVGVALEASEKRAVAVDLKTPRSSNGILGSGVTRRGERDLNRTGIVEETDDEGVRVRRVAGNLAQPPETVLSFVPEVGSDRENGVCEAFSPHVAGDAFVARGSGAMTCSSGKFSLGGAYAHVAVKTIGLAVLIGGACPVLKDVVTRVLKVDFTFPGGADEAFPVGLVEYGDDTTTAANRLVASDAVDFQALNGSRNVVFGDVVRRGLGGVTVEDVLGQSGWKKTREVVGVAGVEARFAAGDGHAGFGVNSRHVGRQIQVEQFVGQRFSVGSRINRSYGQNFERPSPVQRQLDLEDVCVGVGVARFGALSNSGCRVVDPNPIILFVNGAAEKSIGECRVLTFHLEDVEAVLFAHNCVSAKLAVGGEIAVLKLIASETLMAAGVLIVEDRHREAGEAVHVHLVRSETGGGANRVVVGELDVREMKIPIVLSLVDDHGEHLSHGVVDAFNPTVAVGMVGTCSDFAHVEALKKGNRQFGAELKTIVGQDAGRAAPERYVFVDQNVSGALGGEGGV